MVQAGDMLHPQIRSTRRRKGSGKRGRTPKTAEIVALDIVRSIADADLRPGDRLGPEAQLVAQYQVGRVSLREALRFLEIQGLVEVRPGPGASTAVGHATAADLAQMMSLYFQLRGATCDELLEGFVLTAPLLAELAARNPDRSRVEDAMAPFLGDGEGRLGPNTIGLFHDAVADLANNRVLGLTLGAIHVILSTQASMPEQAIDDHLGIAKAIRSGRAQVAGLLMAEHARALANTVRACWPGKVGEKIQSGPR